MSGLEAELRDNLDRIKDVVAVACRRAGRSPHEVTVVCVSKTVVAPTVAAAYAAGARDFGENYGQHLRDKSHQLEHLEGLRWHFIGPLQKNKVKYAVGTAVLLHAVDSRAILEAIDARADRIGVEQEVLVQLNLSGESSKSGIPPEGLDTLLDSFARRKRTRCVGLMTMPPFFDDPERIRPIFAELRRLRDQAAQVPRPNVSLHHLSMGMSGDFEVAIEEGATLVRIGTAIFGARPT
jgi:hypothetical protein